MPVAKIHLSAGLDPQRCQALADEVRDTVVRALGLNPEMGKVILYPSPSHCRSVHPSRQAGFVLAEILMFPGRSRERKDRLLKELSPVLSQHTGLDGNNVFISIQESGRENWGLRGGVPADQIDLGY